MLRAHTKAPVLATAPSTMATVLWPRLMALTMAARDQEPKNTSPGGRPTSKLGGKGTRKRVNSERVPKEISNAVCKEHQQLPVVEPTLWRP